MNLFSGFLVIWLVTVAAFDLGARRVPNWLQLSGLAIGIGALFIGQQPFGVSPGHALMSAVLVFGFLLIFYALGWMGAGDVKFAAVLAVWLGYELMVPVWCLGSLIAMVHALCVFAARRMPAVMPWSPAARVMNGLGAATDGDGGGHAAGQLSGEQEVSAGSLGSAGSTKNKKSTKARSIPYAAYLAIGVLVVIHSKL